MASKSDAKFYLLTGGLIEGPFTADELITSCETGRVKADARVRKRKGEWQTIESVAALRRAIERGQANLAFEQINNGPAQAQDAENFMKGDSQVPGNHSGTNDPSPSLWNGFCLSCHTVKPRKGMVCANCRRKGRLQVDSSMPSRSAQETIAEIHARFQSAEELLAKLHARDPATRINYQRNSSAGIIVFTIVLVAIVFVGLIVFLAENEPSSPGVIRVKGYHRSNGTYVAPHYRTTPNRSKADNLRD